MTDHPYLGCFKGSKHSHAGVARGQSHLPSAPGDFRLRSAKFRRPARPAAARPWKGQDFLRPPALLAGAALAFMGGEHHVFRAVLYSIVLTLTVGQDAGLLCKVWCSNTTSAECPHQDSTTSPSVGAEDSCRHAVVGAVACIREDARRTTAPDAQNAPVIARFRLAPSPTDLGFGPESGRRRLLEERPLVITLRI